MPLRCASIGVEKVRRRLMIDEILWRRIIPQSIMTLAAQMVPTEVEVFVPRRTGNLQSSAEIQVRATSVRVWFEAPYATYVDEGFPPSPGRYVPEPLQKRLISTSTRRQVAGAEKKDIGMHPGYRGAHFSVELANQLKQDLWDIAESVIRATWGA